MIHSLCIYTIRDYFSCVTHIKVDVKRTECLQVGPNFTNHLQIYLISTMYKNLTVVLFLINFHFKPKIHHIDVE